MSHRSTSSHQEGVSTLYEKFQAQRMAIMEFYEKEQERLQESVEFETICQEWKLNKASEWRRRRRELQEA